jgi:hypothetical protein
MFLKKIAAIGGNIKNVSSLGLAASLVEELCNHQTKGHEKTRIHHQHLNVWERNYRDCSAKIRRFMELTKQFLENRD